MANVAHLILIDFEPDLDPDEWPQPLGITGGAVVPNSGTFISEGTHTEPTIGQIWPR